jgi:biotin carboxyl carrier protein
VTPAKRFSVRVAGDDSARIATVVGDTVQVEGSDAAFTVVRSADGCYLVSDGARTWTVFVAGPADARQVFVDGVTAELEVSSDRTPRKRPRASHGDVTAAPMPATVLQILVDVGQVVSQGDVVLKLEAMKMEMPIRAPRSGTVAAIHCRAGELVQPGISLVDIA